MSITIKEEVKFDLLSMTVKDLKKAVTKGGDNYGSLFSTVSGALQRINQAEEWMKNGHKRSKEFMYCLITGSGALDNIIIVPIELVLQSLQIKKEQQSKKDQPMWEETISHVQKDIEAGSRYYIIDGQNRLVNAIKGFYENVYPLGDKKITAVDGDNTFYLNGKTYKDLPTNCQEYIDNIELPVLAATQGDIDSFVDSLIAKNEGLPWEEWMKMITKNWYSLYRKNIKTITENPQVRSALDKISGKQYAYDKNGHDLLVSELIIWMDTQHQPNKLTQHLPYLNGSTKVKDTKFSKLKSYIIEFGKGYAKQKTVTNVEFRNYIMFRYALDHQNEFKTLALPNFKVESTVDFVNMYRIINEVLQKDPAGREIRQVHGKKVIVKVPMGYYWACSEYGQEYLMQRLVLLSEMFVLKQNDLERQGIVKVVDGTPMPSLSEIYENNPVEYSMGKKLRPSEVTSDFFDRGHIIAKNNGGSNKIDNLVIQEKSHNRSVQDADLV